MGKLTEFLKLFQYDPAADKTKTFNITEALNNNWDKIEASAVAIAAQFTNKAQGNPETGDALDAEKLGGKAYSGLFNTDGVALAAIAAQTAAGFTFPTVQSWTPVVYGDTVAGTPTYESRSGWCVKYGSLLLFGGYVKLSSLGGAKGRIKVRGLPFAPIRDTAIDICYVLGFAATNGWIKYSTSEIMLFKTGAGGLVDTDLTYPAELDFSGTMIIS